MINDENARLKIGKYEIRDLIGQGGFGVVYRAWDPDLERVVAIKLCHRVGPDARQRFLREAKIAARFQHPNITVIHELGIVDDQPFLVQEYLAGRDLKDVLADEPGPNLATRLDYLRQIASGLQYAHERQVIHRDIKPANCRVLDDGSVKILDFGIAKLLDSETEYTGAGVLIGTTPYLAPEVWQGATVDARTDIFAFGVLAYEVLSGRRPFNAAHRDAVSFQILHHEPVSLSTSERPHSEFLERLIQGCLKKRPEERHQTLEPLMAGLERARLSAADSALGGRFGAAPSRLSEPTTRTLNRPHERGEESAGSSGMRRLRTRLARWVLVVAVALVGITVWTGRFTEEPTPSVVPNAPPAPVEASPNDPERPLAERLIATGFATTGIEIDLITGGQSVADSVHRVTVGAPLRFRVEVARAGYLMLFFVSDDGTVTLVYPSADGQGLAVSTDRVLELPLVQDRLELSATEVGRERCFALVSPRLLVPEHRGATSPDGRLTFYPRDRSQTFDSASRFYDWLAGQAVTGDGWAIASLDIEAVERSVTAPNEDIWSGS